MIGVQRRWECIYCLHQKNIFQNKELVALCEEYAKMSGGSITLTEDVKAGTKDADVLYTDGCGGFAG